MVFSFNPPPRESSLVVALCFNYAICPLSTLTFHWVMGKKFMAHLNVKRLGNFLSDKCCHHWTEWFIINASEGKCVGGAVVQSYVKSMLI